KQKRPEVTAAHGTVSHNLQTPCGKLLAIALMIWQWPRTLHGTTHRRAISSVGRALRLHRRCRRFEPVIAHHFSSRHYQIANGNCCRGGFPQRGDSSCKEPAPALVSILL